jgi:hypothetical protein
MSHEPALRKPERLLIWGDEKRLRSRIKMMFWTRKRLRWLSALAGDIKKILRISASNFEQERA